MYNSKYNGIKQSGGKQANLAHAVSHISAVRVSEKSNYCSLLKKSLQKISSKNDVPLKILENLFHNITKKFNEKDHDAKVEGEQIGKVLDISSDILKFLMGNKKILKGLERVIRKEIKPSDNDFENGFGSEGGFGNGFGDGSEGGFGNGFGDGFRPGGGRPGSGDGFRPDGGRPGFDNGFGPGLTGRPSTPWWASSTPPPFWNSTHMEWNETWWQSTSNWNSSKPWWQSSTPPPFWNTSHNWNETFWQSTFNWNYTTWESSTTTTTTELYNSSYYDYYGGPDTEYGGGYDYSYNTNNESYDSTGLDYGTSAGGYDYDYGSYDNTGTDYGASTGDDGFDYGFGDYYGDDGEIPTPPINVNASAKELKDEFESLEENEVNDLLSSLDENSMWEIYEKLNGTDIGSKLEEKLFESGYDEESDGWATVFGDTSSFFRKKRQVGDFDKMDPKDMKNLASMGLQGLMIMDPEDIKLPRPLSQLRHEIPMCLKEILWESDGNSRLCAEIPDKLKGKLRDLMMMILKQEISTNFFTVDWMFVASLFENAKDEFEEIGKGIISKVMVPIKVNDLKELLESVKKVYKKNIIDKAKENGGKNLLMLIVDLIDVLKDEDILEEVVGLINRIQGLQ